MDRAGYKRWLILVTWAFIVQHVLGSGTMDIVLLSYSGDGTESSGNCCDRPWPWGCSDDPCDPYFIVCVDIYGGSGSVQVCSYRRIQTGWYDDKDWIPFGSDLGNGVANPILISVASVPNNYNVKAAVYEYDPLNDDDHIDNIDNVVTNLIPEVNGGTGGYRDVQLRKTDRAILNIRVRSYCDEYWYGVTCTKRCKDNEYGHYTCNTETGDKTCHAGWEGIDCNADINECSLDYCKNGANCTNFDGGFTCHCREGFKGDLCEETTHECVISPCLNGGTCHGNETTDFTCECLPWWSGQLCEAEVDPCDVTPCYNNATCIYNTNTTTGFTCSCDVDWTGEICDVKVVTTTTTITTTVIPFGDAYNITLLGVIDQTNYQELVEGLISLINNLGGVEGQVYVKVITQIVPIQPGVTTTHVEFSSALSDSAIDVTLIDDIFTANNDTTINSYLPLPLYRPTAPESDPIIQEPWLTENWYIIVIPAAFALALLVCLAGFVVFKGKKVESQESKGNTVQQVMPANIAYDNVTYHEAFKPGQSVILDPGSLTISPSQKALVGGQPPGGAFAYDYNPYSEPVHYGSPGKQTTLMSPFGGFKPYQTWITPELDMRSKTGAKDYTKFKDLKSAMPIEESPYEDLDDVIARKAAQEGDDISVDYSDDEPDVKKYSQI